MKQPEQWVKAQLPPSRHRNEHEMKTADDKPITQGKILATATFKVLYIPHEQGERSDDELITALCEKYLAQARISALEEAAEIVRRRWNQMDVPAERHQVYLAQEAILSLATKLKEGRE